jgi:hypothetical protein
LTVPQYHPPVRTLKICKGNSQRFHWCQEYKRNQVVITKNLLHLRKWIIQIYTNKRFLFLIRKRKEGRNFPKSIQKKEDSVLNGDCKNSNLQSILWRVYSFFQEPGGLGEDKTHQLGSYTTSKKEDNKSPKNLPICAITIVTKST